ncbi:hypothetical protein Pcinc_035829 [Petrolisthes cinctipes]|uniref:Uncharacterized protein n=1 Tax=Petrolisthes cinctipes TaxID=88211 RepID=A0AAE1C040_PETCI|nr:hypothetical protein Pcinc_035829 [Petrolisthes cinctipes]
MYPMIPIPILCPFLPWTSFLPRAHHTLYSYTLRISQPYIPSLSSAPFTNLHSLATQHHTLGPTTLPSTRPPAEGGRSVGMIKFVGCQGQPWPSQSDRVEGEKRGSDVSREERGKGEGDVGRGERGKGRGKRAKKRGELIEG